MPQTQTVQPTQSNAPTAPTPVVTKTGFRVESVTGGASTTKGSVGELGQVSWAPTGHATLSSVGMAAVVGQIATYLSGLALRGTEQASVTGPSGNYSCQNVDLAAQQTAVVNILATAANVTGAGS